MADPRYPIGPGTTGEAPVRQVVHHVADSQINAYCRFRLALTEDRPTIRAYDEGEWAKLDDAANAPVGPSLTLIRALHDSSRSGGLVGLP